VHAPRLLTANAGKEEEPRMSKDQKIIKVKVGLLAKASPTVTTR
jgi:hypothetical protein